MNKEQYYQDLKAQKIAAGLNAEQAEEVTKRQREQDEANGLFKAEKEAKAPAKTDDQTPVNPPAPPAPPAGKPPAGKGKNK